ncbi:MAG: DUF2953 domain-containing protein [Candidatus Saccharibacteria bacterium]
MIILQILLVFVITMIALLSVPLFFTGQISRKESLDGSVQLLWGGLIGARVIFLGKQPTVYFRFGPWSRRLNQKMKASEEKKNKTVSKAKKRNHKTNNGTDWGLVKSAISKAVWEKLLGYLKRLFRSLNLKGRIDGEYGFDDPSLTGMLCGLLAALNLDNPKIAMEPNFADTIIRFDSDLSFRIIPVQILWITAGFAFSRVIRAIWWPLIFKRKRKRRLNLNVQGEY